VCQRLLLAWYFIVHRGQTSLEIIMCDFANASKGIRICWSYLTCNVYHMHIHFTSTLWIINLGCRFMEPFIICGVRFWVWLTWASFLLGPICLHRLNFRILCCELFGNVDFRKVPLVKSTPPLSEDWLFAGSSFCSLIVRLVMIIRATKHVALSASKFWVQHEFLYCKVLYHLNMVLVQVETVGATYGS